MRGDSAEMVPRGSASLAAGHFEPLGRRRWATWWRAAVEPEPALRTCLLDLGAGTGWYLARVLDRLPAAHGLALDVSKPALRRAARAHPRLAAVGRDAWGPLPLRDARRRRRAQRLRPSQRARDRARAARRAAWRVVVTPAPGHLEELVAPLGLLGVDERKRQRLPTSSAPRLEIVGHARARAGAAPRPRRRPRRRRDGAERVPRRSGGRSTSGSPRCLRSSTSPPPSR